MSTFCHSTLPTTTSNRATNLLECFMEYHSWHVEISMNSGFLDTNLTRTLPHWLLWGWCKKPAWLHQHSRYQWNFSFFRTDLSTHLAQFHRLQTYLGFMLLVPLLVVVVELQKHFPLSNNTPVTTYVHRMIIRCHVCWFTWGTMNALLCFSSAFWIIQNKNCICVSFRCWKITFKSVHRSQRAAPLN